MPSPDERRALGLRERKKARTKATIQHHALRLFQAQGYDATTVEQIAEAAEISPSTFFRYFPTKEEVALYDDLDPVLIAAYRAQPPELNPLAAMRGALRDVFAHLPASEGLAQAERARLVLEVPELRMRMLDQLTAAMDLMCQLIAERTGSDPHAFTLRVYAGALIGALMAGALDSAQRGDFDFARSMEASLRYLEDGLPL